MITHSKEDIQLKATALALFLFVLGAVSGFLVAYGIAYWGW